MTVLNLKIFFMTETFWSWTLETLRSILGIIDWFYGKPREPRDWFRTWFLRFQIFHPTTFTTTSNKENKLNLFWQKRKKITLSQVSGNVCILIQALQHDTSWSTSITFLTDSICQFSNRQGINSKSKIKSLPIGISKRMPFLNFWPTSAMTPKTDWFTPFILKQSRNCWLVRKLENWKKRGITDDHNYKRIRLDPQNQ